MPWVFFLCKKEEKSYTRNSFLSVILLTYTKMPKYTTIWIDCDDVLSDTMNTVLTTPFFTEKKVTKADITSYNLREIPKLNVSIAQGYEIFRNFCISEDFRRMRPLPGAREKLETWKKENKKLIIITWRSADRKPQTVKRLNQYFPGIFHPENIIFAEELTNKEKSKVELCQEAGIEIMIEDRLPITQELAKHGIPSILFDTPRSKLPAGETENPLITRVRNWNEIEIS